MGREHHMLRARSHLLCSSSLEVRYGAESGHTRDLLNLLRRTQTAEVDVLEQEGQAYAEHEPYDERSEAVAQQVGILGDWWHSSISTHLHRCIGCHPACFGSLFCEDLGGVVDNLLRPVCFGITVSERKKAGVLQLRDG